MCRGRMSSWIRMTSPLRRLLDLCGFWTSWKFLIWSRYSFCQRFQKSSESFSLSRNSLASSFLVSGSGPVGVVIRPPPIRKCSGVRASESLPCVIGLEFTVASMLISVVLSCSSVIYSVKTTCISNQHYKPGNMFRFTEPSSGQFLKQSAFSECTPCGIPYCLQVILTLKITSTWGIMYSCTVTKHNYVL